MGRIRSLAFVILSIATLTVAVVWPCSYFFGGEMYHSVWFRSPHATREQANWVISNYGSLGFAWRTQKVIPPMASLPEPGRNWRNFQASAEQLSHIHPEGAGSWHWIHWHSKTTPMGTSTTTYSHLYLPYWLILLPLFLAMWLLRARKKAEQNVSEVPAPIPEKKENRMVE